MRFSKLVAVRDRIGAGFYESPALVSWLADRLIEEMNMEHSKHPWEVDLRWCEPVRGHHVLYVTAGPEIIAQCWLVGALGSEMSRRTAESEANAHLISAAPDLLQACEKGIGDETGVESLRSLASFMEREGYTADSLRLLVWADRMEAAVLKAKGGE